MEGIEAKAAEPNEDASKKASGVFVSRMFQSFSMMFSMSTSYSLTVPCSYVVKHM